MDDIMYYPMFFFPFALFFLLLLFCISTFFNAFKKLPKREQQTFVQKDELFFYKKIHLIFFKKSAWNTLLFCINTTRHFLQMLYILFCFIPWMMWQPEIFSTAAFILFTIFAFGLFIFFGDLLPRTLVRYAPIASLKYTTPPASLALTLFSPLCRLFHFTLCIIGLKTCTLPFHEGDISSKEKLLDIIEDLDDETVLNTHDKRLFSSVLTFRNRIAREVMVPRIDLFCLPHDTSIREAAQMPEIKEFSRIPLYKNTQDHIVGILMYKDLISQYMEYEANNNDPKYLDIPLEEIVKPALYSPETQKLSQLLQEFRKKQTHLAVIVDEYGGTSGIVTIEDILEELVGEISDEYDEEEVLFRPHARGSWIVSGKATLVDLEEETGIKVPQEGDYDTIAGYIFFCLGSIPKKGVKIHHDAFEIEVMKSDDRSVDKVKITPLPLMQEEQES